MTEELNNKLLEALKGQVIQSAIENNVDNDNITRITAAFSIGSVQRINLAWHGNGEEPREDKLIIVQLTDGDYEIGFYDEGLFMEIIIRWAYVEDLLPERKEEQK